jgi:hypothetical protein
MIYQRRFISSREAAKHEQPLRGIGHERLQLFSPLVLGDESPGNDRTTCRVKSSVMRPHLVLPSRLTKANPVACSNVINFAHSVSALRWFWTWVLGLC